MFGGFVLAGLNSLLVVLWLVGILEVPVTEGVNESTYKQTCYKVTMVFILMQLKP